MIKPILGDGEAYVEGRSEETARKLYEAAVKAGIDPAKVFTTSHGYVVPEELVAKKGKKAAAKEEEKQEEEAPAEEAPEVPAEEEGGFDPAEHTVAEVKEYLAEADDAERDRVLGLESKSESPRAGVLKLGEGAK
jgi:hypothetical protein